MTADALMIPGGIGLFLLGMAALSEGLRALAGEGLRGVLARFTSSPTRGALAGAVATAAIQSSSATTLMTVGFVGAGLMSFPQAVGVILGANVGATITGWMVALVGFKLDLGLAGLPLLFLAMLGRRFGRGRVRDAAWALAGFCLIFIGIDALKDGMAAFGDVVTPDRLPSGGWLARLQLVGLGVLLTVITQSSSAGVATALAALGAGAIDFPQAAATVIGMDVGTTFTALMASVGGSAAMRRTALAHMLYNVLTGTAAFLLLGPLSALASAATPDAQVALVAFHTSFNALGVLCVLPVAHRFARLVERLAPERGETDAARLARIAAVIGRREAPFRRWALRETAAGRLGAAEAERRLAAMRWLQRTANHLARIAAHLASAEGPLARP
jgi:phosphate:Na+ symporter